MGKEYTTSAESTPLREELGRDLSPFHLTMLGLGMMIGAGVFLGVGFSIHEAGPGGAVLTFAFNGIIALFTAMVYAELSSALPHAGGAYNFTRLGFGKGPGFLAGWIEWFAACIAGSMFALTFAVYTLHYLEQTQLLDLLRFAAGSGNVAGIGINLGIADGANTVPEFITVKSISVGVVLVFLFINTRSAAGGGKFASILTLGQMLFLLVIIGGGIVTAVSEPSRIANFSPFLPRGNFRILITMGFTFVAFEGFEVIARAGDEARRPRQYLPKAILYSVFLVTIIYVFVTFTSIVAVGPQPGPAGTAPWQWIGGFQELGFAVAVTSLFPGANLLVTVAVMFASISALNTTIFSAVRSSFGLGRDGMLPRFLTKVTIKRKVPLFAFFLTGAIIVAAVFALEIEQVVALASFLFLFLFILVDISAVRIRRRLGKKLIYGFIMPLFPLIPLLAVLFQLVIITCIVQMSRTAVYIGLVWIIAGGFVYFIYTRKRAVTLDTERYISGEDLSDDFRKRDDTRLNIVVAVSNPENAHQLLSATKRISAGSDSIYNIIHMIRTPPQIPLEEAENYLAEEHKEIFEIMLYLSNSINIETTVRYCRNIARGLVNVVREKETNLLVLGWKGARHNTGFKYGKIIDTVLERTPSAVAVVKNYVGKVYKKVLVPIAGGPNAGLAMEIGSIIASEWEGKITLLTVTQTDPQKSKNRKGKAIGTEFNLSGFLGKNKHRLHIPVENVSIRSIISKERIADVIVQESKTYDMVVMGCSYETLLKRNRTGVVPERVADSITIPLIMVKAQNPMKSVFRRWF